MYPIPSPGFYTKRKVICNLLSEYVALCEDGGKYWNESCYYKMEGCMTQQNAHAQCISKGARLLEISREEESRFIQERIVNGSLVWLDLIRSGSGKDDTEKRLNIITYFPAYGLRMPIYGSNLSQYGKIWDRIQAFFVLVPALGRTSSPLFISIFVATLIIRQNLKQRVSQRANALDGVRNSFVKVRNPKMRLC